MPIDLHHNFRPNMMVLHVGLNSRRITQPMRRGKRREKQTWRPMSTKQLTVFLLMIAGDIEYNPGPTRSRKQPTFKFPCVECAKPVKSNQRGIQCDFCCEWCHVNCIGMASNEYRDFCDDETLTWSCRKCLFPYTDSFFETSQDLESESFPSVSDEPIPSVLNEPIPSVLNEPTASVLDEPKDAEPLYKEFTELRKKILET